MRLQAAARGLLGRRHAQVLCEKKKRSDRIDASHAELKALFERVRHQLAALQLQEAAVVRLQVAMRGFLAKRQAREAQAQFRSSARAQSIPMAQAQPREAVEGHLTAAVTAAPLQSVALAPSRCQRSRQGWLGHCPARRRDSQKRRGCTRAEAAWSSVAAAATVPGMLRHPSHLFAGAD
jgi:hypothetical protein